MSTRISLRQIEAFRAVFVTGSMTGAGNKIGVSQPAVSRLIRDLEAEIGLRLFHRQGTQITPTEDASILFKEVERSFHGLDRISKVAAELSGTRRGSLRITTTLSVSMFLLPDTIASFRALWPDTKITIHTAISPDVLDLVEMQYFDFGIALQTSAGSGIEIEPLISMDAVCILPPGHSLIAKDVIRVEDLARQPIISLSGNNLIQPRIDALFAQAQVVPEWVLETSYGTTISTYVAHGLGIAIVDPFMAQAYEQQGVITRPFEPSFPYHFNILFTAQRARTDVAESFCALLRENVSKMTAKP
jgi:DNA-binding transcriptional LysR family regulator